MSPVPGSVDEAGVIHLDPRGCSAPSLYDFARTGDAVNDLPLHASAAEPSGSIQGGIVF